MKNIGKLLYIEIILIIIVMMIINFIAVAPFKTKVTGCFPEYSTRQYKKDKLNK